MALEETPVVGEDSWLGKVLDERLKFSRGKKWSLDLPFGNHNNQRTFPF